MRKLLTIGALVGAATYFFDRQNGARRRNMARDRLFGMFRRAGRKGGQLGQAAASEAYGVTQKVEHFREEEKPQPDDVTLARKVETEIFRDSDVPKGQVNVNVEHGKVVLRGEVQTPEMIRDLEAQARKVQGVQDVENLLHTPGTPAQMHQSN